jgi:adenylate kinase
VIVGSVIALSGTPGTGKSAVGQLLATKLSVECLELNQLVIDHRFYLGEDADRRTLIADVDKLRNHLEKLLDDTRARYVIVGHFADEVPKHRLEVLVILRCNPIILTQRLRKRGWSEEKIIENIQAELLGECTAQALIRHERRQIFEIDTSEKTPPATVIAIENILAGKGNHYAVGQISWLHRLKPQLIHLIMEEKTLPS